MNENSILQVKKFWLDPKNIMSPIKIENLLGYNFVPSENAEDHEFDAFLKKIRPMNIETLGISMASWDLHDMISNKPWNFDWILNFKNLKKLTINGQYGVSSVYGFPLDVDLSYMLDVLKKIHGMKMVVFESWELKKEFFGQFLKQFPPGLTLVIQGNCTFSFEITSLLEILNSLGEMKALLIISTFLITTSLIIHSAKSHHFKNPLSLLPPLLKSTQPFSTSTKIHSAFFHHY